MNNLDTIFGRLTETEYSVKGKKYHFWTANLPLAPLIEKKLKHNWNKKVYEYQNNEVFAELIVRTILITNRWEGAWWAANPGKHIHWLTEWKDLPLSQQPVATIIPEVSDIIECIASDTHNKKRYSGCWDIVAWKNGALWFLDIKGKDSLQETQMRWVEAAERYGIPHEHFVIVHVTPNPTTSLANTSMTNQ